MVKPKKASLQKQQQFKKKHSAGLASMTEKSLAAKAGHLEVCTAGLILVEHKLMNFVQLLRGGKKDSKLADASAKQGKK